MEFEKFVRLSKVLRELNISLDRAVDFLNLKGIKIEARPTTKISNETYKLLLDNFDDDKSSKVESNEVLEEKRKEKEIQRIKLEEELKVVEQVKDGYEHADNVMAFFEYETKRDKWNTKGGEWLPQLEWRYFHWVSK